MDKKVRVIEKYCEIVRDNILHDMEVSPGFMALLQQCENVISLLSEKEKEIDELKEQLSYIKRKYDIIG